jgi:hypothetical protein
MHLRPIRTSGVRTTTTVAVACAAVLALTFCAGLAAPAQTDAVATIAPSPGTFASITPILSPDRLGAKASLTITIDYTGGAFGVPAAVSHADLKLPAGLSLDIPQLRSCSAAHLLARGPRGCPAQSELGGGHALVGAHTGSETITENATLWLFLGPLDNLQPTFEILAQGYTPIDERKVFGGSVIPASPPYGEELEMSVPPIPTLVLEPDASVIAFSLTVGASRHHASREATSVVVPSSCPVGGFPFAAEFTYADGSGGSALATEACPR